MMFGIGIALMVMTALLFIAVKYTMLFSGGGWREPPKTALGRMLRKLPGTREQRLGVMVVVIGVFGIFLALKYAPMRHRADLYADTPPTRTELPDTMSRSISKHDSPKTVNNPDTANVAAVQDTGAQESNVIATKSTNPGFRISEKGKSMILGIILVIVAGYVYFNYFGVARSPLGQLGVTILALRGIDFAVQSTIGFRGFGIFVLVSIAAAIALIVAAFQRRRATPPPAPPPVR